MKSQSNYKVIHPMYGVWYATSLYGAAKTIGCNPSLIYNNLDKKNTFKGWTIEETILDFSDIPSKFINAENNFVKKFHMNMYMKMEEANSDERVPELDEVQMNILRMAR